MEQYKKNKAPELDTPIIQSEETLPQEAEASQDQTDKIKHSSEQSSANIFSGTNSPQQTVSDNSILPLVVDDSIVSDYVQPSLGAKKIDIADEAIASDKDFEKIWVDRAKAIINNAQGDPHKKNANLTTAKDQYKSARFNKLISER
jgi:hypothetical protein